MKKQLPILMSTMMVQAELAGRKTMTRRVIKWPTAPEWHDWDYEPDTIERRGGGEWWPQYRHRNGTRDVGGPLKCPYGQPGDILYVREEYYQLGHWEEVPGVKTKGGRMKWKFVPGSEELSFDEPATYRKGRHHKDPHTPAIHKRLARFMPKVAARIWLEVTGIRVERLQAIDPHDAGDEGVEYWNVDWEALEGGELQADYKNYTWRDDPAYEDYNFPTFANPVDSFRTLWQSINGAESWHADPWVWVVSFRILSTTGKPAGLEKEVAG